MSGLVCLLIGIRRMIDKGPCPWPPGLDRQQSCCWIDRYLSLYTVNQRHYDVDGEDGAAAAVDDDDDNDVNFPHCEAANLHL